ncbi:TIGR02117 family protein [Pontibacter rugosus]
MQRLLNVFFRTIDWFLAVATSSVLSFIFLAFLLSGFPVISSYAQEQQQSKKIEIFVTSNGVHTNLVLPVSTPYIDWRHKLPLQQFAHVDSSYKYVAFGWGDKRFFMQTPEWKDITPGVALAAAFWPTSTAMHVTYIKSKLVENRRQQPILITPEQYQLLISYIDRSFVQQENAFQHITGSGYTRQDTFYEAHGRYHVLKNCNNWVNRGLKSMNHKSALWAPVPFAIMRHLR